MESMELLQGFTFQENSENMIFGQPFDSNLIKNIPSASIMPPLAKPSFWRTPNDINPIIGLSSCQLALK